jgi:hypothetical protein
MSSSVSFTLQTADGGQNSQTLSRAGIEADLDIQYTVGVGTGVKTVFISGSFASLVCKSFSKFAMKVGDQNQDGDLDGFLDTINLLLGESNPLPQVLTTSESIPLSCSHLILMNVLRLRAERGGCVTCLAEVSSSLPLIVLSSHHLELSLPATSATHTRRRPRAA